MKLIDLKTERRTSCLEKTNFTFGIFEWKKEHSHSEPWQKVHRPTNKGNISSLRVTKAVVPWGRAKRNVIAVQYACAFVQNVPQGSKHTENLKSPILSEYACAFLKRVLQG